MNQKQRELLDDVIKALADPKSSPYYGMLFQQAADLLKAKLEEIKQISDYEEQRA